MKSIVLVGDSITQQGFQSGWVSILADSFIRRAEVYNKGYSGYTTKWVLQMLQDEGARPYLVPPHLAAPPGPALEESNVLFATVFLGANDANIPSHKQHVPIPDFKSNLHQIVQELNAGLRPRKIILITPPPIDEVKYLSHVKKSDPNATECFRILKRTREYRNAVIEVARDHALAAEGRVLVLDLFTVLMGPEHTEEEYAAGTHWSNYFDDGLHLNALGGEAVGRALVTLAQTYFPLESFPQVLPHWDQFK